MDFFAPHKSRFSRRPKKNRKRTPDIWWIFHLLCPAGAERCRSQCHRRQAVDQPCRSRSRAHHRSEPDVRSCLRVGVRAGARGEKVKSRLFFYEGQIRKHLVGVGVGIHGVVETEHLLIGTDQYALPLGKSDEGHFADAEFAAASPSASTSKSNGSLCLDLNSRWLCSPWSETPRMTAPSFLNS